MSEQSISRGFFDRYLYLLGVERDKPDYENLCRIVAAHLTRVPFENISKLYYRKRYNQRTSPDLKMYLDGIEHYNFGGTCYSNNHYLYLLLRHLGYDIMLCGADMNRPDVHIVSIVSLAGREYLIDVGYAAPFLQPLPRDLRDDHIIELGRDRFVLKPQDGQGCSRMEMYRSGELRHGYLAKPIPRTIDHFNTAIEQSYTDTATFANSLLLVRFWPNRSLAIFNLSVIESEGREYEEQLLPDRDELAATVVEHFDMPQEIVTEAISELGELGDAWT